MSIHAYVMRSEEVEILGENCKVVVNSNNNSVAVERMRLLLKCMGDPGKQHQKKMSKLIFIWADRRPGLLSYFMPMVVLNYYVLDLFVHTR